MAVGPRKQLFLITRDTGSLDLSLHFACLCDTRKDWEFFPQESCDIYEWPYEKVSISLFFNFILLRFFIDLFLLYLFLEKEEIRGGKTKTSM